MTATKTVIVSQSTYLGSRYWFEALTAAQQELVLKFDLFLKRSAKKINSEIVEEIDADLYEWFFATLQMKRLDLQNDFRLPIEIEAVYGKDGDTRESYEITVLTDIVGCHCDYARFAVYPQKPVELPKRTPKMALNSTEFSYPDRDAEYYSSQSDCPVFWSQCSAIYADKTNADAYKTSVYVDKGKSVKRRKVCVS